MKISKLECSPSANLCSFHECSLTPVNKTAIKVTGRCVLKEPLPFLEINLVIELKNNKNEYFTFINETVDYCDKLGTGHQGTLGIVEKLFKEVAPDVLQTCPIKNNWGVENLMVDSSVLNNYPIWAAPFKTGRGWIKAYGKKMEYLGEFRVHGEIVVE